MPCNVWKNDQLTKILRNLGFNVLCMGGGGGGVGNTCRHEYNVDLKKFHKWKFGPRLFSMIIEKGYIVVRKIRNIP